MSELENFEAKVRQNIKLLSSDNPKTRRKAAEWLGEAGDPSAITRLRQVYKEDPDKRVRQTAEYALGMFKALEKGLSGKDEAKVLQRLEDIALRGKMGGRFPIRGRTLARFNLGLLVSLALLLAFNFIIWPQLGPRLSELGQSFTPSASSDAEVKERSTLLSELEQHLRLVQTDANTLQRIYQNVLGGGQVDCSAFFNNPADYDLASIGGENDLRSIAANLNSALSDLKTAKTPYDQACPPNNTPLTAAEVGAPLGTLLNAIRALPEIDTALAVARGEVVQPSDVPTTAAESDLSPVPTVETTINLRSHLSQLYTIIDQMEGARGANVDLNQRWSNVRSPGGRAGCQQAFPTIPNDYILPEADAQASPNLKLAAELVNRGLALVRQGWSQFRIACSSNTLDVDVNAGLQSSQNAKIAFDNAEQILNIIRDGG